MSTYVSMSTRLIKAQTPRSTSHDPSLSNTYTLTTGAIRQAYIGLSLLKQRLIAYCYGNERHQKYTFHIHSQKPGKF